MKINNTYNYIEAIVAWSDKGPSSIVTNWLSEYSMSFSPMRNGLLISGSQELFEAAFHVDLSGSKRPLSLPIPDKLKDFISSIVIPKMQHF